MLVVPQRHAVLALRLDVTRLALIHHVLVSAATGAYGCRDPHRLMGRWSCRRSSTFSSTPPSTPPTGAPSTPCVRPSSTERSAAGIVRLAAPTPNKCSPACCAPLSNASSTRPRCWSIFFARPSPPSPRPSLLPRSRHPGNQLPARLPAADWFRSVNSPGSCVSAALASSCVGRL